MLTRVAELLLFGIIPFLVGSFAASSADIGDREITPMPVVQILDDDPIGDGDETPGIDSEQSE